MAGPADEARQLVDRRTVQLATLHWALASHSTRVGEAMRWLDAIDVAPPASRAPTAGEAVAGAEVGARAADSAEARPQVAESAEAQPQVVLPAEGPAAPDPGTRRLRVIVSESREVSLEVEDTITAPPPEIEPRHRLAS